MKFFARTDGLGKNCYDVGPYDNEPVSFEKMDQFADAQGLRRLENSHREIYLSSANRVEKSKLKTILRYAVERVLST